MAASSSSWTPPSPPPSLPLSLNNTLAHSPTPVEFHSLKPNHIKWYTCGPTVYDSSHLGHARNYVTTDILRRIMQDYFGYDITFVLNITDVDDKIILRARREHLYQQYLNENPSLGEKVLEMVGKSLEYYIKIADEKIAKLEATEKKSAGEAATTAKKEKELAQSKKKELEESVQKELSNAKTLTVSGGSSVSLLEAAKDSLSVYLDSLKGHEFQDHEAIRKHALKFEKEYLDDMKELGVRPADVLTRVSEYIKEVIEYVETIIKNGYGYVAESGSVYFDTHKFNNDSGHNYCKLDPAKFANSEANLKLLAEGEGALATGVASEKKNPQDFALWKSSKPGEPVWDSPWGNGRPGWHIECSAMASHVLGDKIDIHSGGIDLKFPHHDNEVAQAEAYYNHDQWVNYWMHTGHLDINGLKMSKSLKNFITIRQALNGTNNCPKFTPRQLRIMFLLASWDTKMDFQFDMLEEVKQHEKTLSEFFLAVNNVMREENEQTKSQDWREEELVLYKQTEEIITKVDASLRKNLSFNQAFKHLFVLINSTNRYLQNKTRRGLLVRKIGAFVHKILSVFGLLSEGQFSFSSSEEQGGAKKEDVLPPYLDALSNFRNKVRTAAKNQEHHGVFLQECDKLRDKAMPPLGVRLMDDGAFPYSLVDPEQLMKEIEEKEAAERKQKETKLKKRIDALKREIKSYENCPHPKDVYAVDKRYSKLNEEGKPTHKESGEELNKNEKKKIDKDWNAKMKNFEKYRKKEEKEGEGFLEAMKQNLKAVEEELAEEFGVGIKG